MKKPEKTIIKKSQKIIGFDLYKVIDYLSEISNKDFYDYLDSTNHYNDWCDKKGYGSVDPEDNKRSESKIWFKEYVNDINGYGSCPESLDIIVWFIDEFMPESRFEVFEIDRSYLDEEKPEYVKEFLKLLFENFGDEVSLIYDLDS